MKIRYQFVTGEAVEFEVPDTIGKVVIAIDKDMQNSDRRETRRHNSVEELEGKGQQFYDEDSNTEEAVMKSEENAMLLKALEQLLPQQRVLVHKVFFEGRAMVEIAREEGVSAKAIQDRVNKIKARLKTIIENNSF